MVQSPYNPQTLNRYSYCNNNPINLVDPTGHSWWNKWFGKIFGFMAGFLATLFTGNMMVGFQMFNLVNSIGNTVNSGNWGGFAGGLVGGMLGGWAGVNWATGIARTLGENTYTFGGGSLIGAVEMGIAGFGGSFGEAIGSGEGFNEAMKAGGIGLGIGAITGGLVEGSYLGGWQTFAHGLPVEHFVNNGILPPPAQLPQNNFAAGVNSIARTRTRTKFGWERYLHGTSEKAANTIAYTGLKDGSFVTLPEAIDPVTGKIAIRLNLAEFRRFVGHPNPQAGEWFVDVLAPRRSVVAVPPTSAAPEFIIYGEHKVIDTYPNMN